MSKVDNAIIAAVKEIDKEVSRLQKIQRSLQGELAKKTVQAAEKKTRKPKRRIREYAFVDIIGKVDVIVLSVLKRNPDTIMDTKTVVRAVKKDIPNIYGKSVSVSLSQLYRKGIIQREGRGRYIYREKYTKEQL